MLHLQGLTPRREPFTDWCAQVERIIQRATGDRIELDRGSSPLLGCYQCGLSPQEIADDWNAYHERKR